MAEKKASGSFIWNSILWGKGILDTGMRWRVGNGTSIHIYRDNWIPGSYLQKIRSAPNLGLDATVNCLLTPSGNWNLQTLNSNFSKDEVDCILQIPVGFGATKDTIIWNFESTCNYYVKSDYWIGRSLIPKPSTSAPSDTHWWKSLWKLDLPLKVKTFIWKACFNWIPSMANLTKRKLTVEDKCPLCNQVTETTLHALWSCKKLKYVRDGWLPRNVVGKRTFASFFELMKHCSSRLKKEDLQLFCVALWRIWGLRNSFIHDGLTQNPSDAVWWSRNYISEIQNSREATSNRQASMINVLKTWRPSEADLFKINCDAIIKGKTVGIGIVIRDATGFVLASSSQQVQENFDIQVAKTLAILKGIVFSNDCGLYPCILESDNAEVVKRISEENCNYASSGAILEIIAGH